MKIDLLYEIQNPHASEYDAYWQAVEQIELADRMGFDTVWCVEHHFLDGFSHSSAPEVFLAAVSQRTERIRIGHGVVLLPHPFNHPIRVAERIGALDILSNGRVEFGTGRSSPFEQEPFGIDPEESRAMWEEALRVIPRMWTEERFEYSGRYFEIPERSVVPRPIQRPHPPIWMAATSPESWELAGRHGIGILGLTIFVSVDQIAERIAAYRETVRHAVPVGRVVNDQCGAFTVVHCAPTEEEAVANGGTQATVNYVLYAIKVFAGGKKPEERLETDLVRTGSETRATQRSYQDLTKAYPLLEKMVKGELTHEELDAQDMVIVGDPDKCVRKLERYRDAGCDRVLCLMQHGEIPHEAVMASIELFGKHVIPHFDA